MAIINNFINFHKLQISYVFQLNPKVWHLYFRIGSLGVKIAKFAVCYMQYTQLQSCLPGYVDFFHPPISRAIVHLLKLITLQDKDMSVFHIPPDLTTYAQMELKSIIS